MQASIVEHKQIEQVLDYLPERNKKNDTLVIFDIDNTLVEPEVMITSTEWFEHELAQKIKDGVDYQVAIEQLLNLCFEVQTHVPLKLIEQESLAVFQKLKNQKIRVMGLTSRAPIQAEKTVEHLTAFGIEFETSPFQGIALPSDKVYHHHQGIVFCYTYSKGKTLVELLEQQNYRPQQVIFVDDVLKNVQTMKQALQEFDPAVQYTGVHYSRLAYKKEIFDPIKAERELAKIRETIVQ